MAPRPHCSDFKNPCSISDQHVANSKMSSVGLLTSLKRRFYNYPTIFVSYILALSCPVMMLTVYPWRRENGYRPPVDAPRTFPIPQRARVIPSGYED